jgi:hypothetical protein
MTQEEYLQILAGFEAQLRRHSDAWGNLLIDPLSNLCDRCGSPQLPRSRRNTLMQPCPLRFGSPKQMERSPQPTGRPPVNHDGRHGGTLVKGWAKAPCLQPEHKNARGMVGLDMQALRLVLGKSIDAHQSKHHRLRGRCSLAAEPGERLPGGPWMGPVLAYRGPRVRVRLLQDGGGVRRNRCVECARCSQ